MFGCLGLGLVLLVGDLLLVTVGLTAIAIWFWLECVLVAGFVVIARAGWLGVCGLVILACWWFCIGYCVAWVYCLLRFSLGWCCGLVGFGFRGGFVGSACC